MRRSVILSILLATSTAHAMGSDVDTAPVAWNADGTAVLLRTDTSWDGERTTSYEIVSAAAATVRADLSDVDHQNGSDTEKTTVADCTRAAQQLARALGAAKFNDMTIHADACKRDRADIVVIGAAQQKAVEQAWVALPQGRPPSAREQAAIDALAVAEPNYRPIAPNQRGTGSDDTCTPSDVTSATGKLVVILSTFGCGSPVKVRWRAFAPGKTGMVERGADNNP